MKVKKFVIMLAVFILIVLAMSFCLLGKKGFIHMLIPSTFGSITAAFSYLAYLHTKEKFRLELFEKRWDIYEQVVRFLSIAHNTTTNYEEFHLSAHNSFRGIGGHKYKLLFGSDVQNLLSRLNEIYAFLTAHSTIAGENADKWAKYMHESGEILSNLDKSFKKYLYFGNYKM